MTAHAQTDDFDIGKEIFDKLKDLPPERQQRILRWVSEGLGVVNPIALQQAQPSATATASQPSRTITPATGTGTDIKTFIAAKAPKSDSQFTAAVAYYYRFEAPPAERRDSIDSALLQESTRLAGRDRFHKPLNTLNNAQKAGYLNRESRGLFSISSVGENLVAMTLPGGGETSIRPAKKRKAKAKKTKKR